MKYVIIPWNEIILYKDPGGLWGRVIKTSLLIVNFSDEAVN